MWSRIPWILTEEDMPTAKALTHKNSTTVAMRVKSQVENTELEVEEKVD